MCYYERLRGRDVRIGDIEMLQPAPTREAIATDAKGNQLMISQGSRWLLWLAKLVSVVNELDINSLPVHADNASATAAGLAQGRKYRTATGSLMIVY